jgi:two-component system, LytTR family, response regulator LytT
MPDAKHGLTVLAVDDEELALRDLVVMLSRSPEIDQVVTAGSGAEALDVLSSNPEIDALFVDLSMPGMSGIELGHELRALRRELPVAFVTAHDEHAIEAYDLDVVDYVLKPVAPRRLHDTIARMARRVGPTGDAAVVDVVDAPADQPDVLISRHRDRVVVLRRDDVRLVEACGDYVRVHVRVDVRLHADRAGTAGGHLVRASIGALAEQWEPFGFVRVHRGFLVRLAAIAEIRTTTIGHVAVVDGREVPVSRRYRPQLNEHLSRRR